jgi:phosphoribosylcarboxyaminoimidazole (NCAIR) mutase
MDAARSAASILANKYPAVREKLLAFRAKQTQEVMEKPNPAG